MAFCIIMGTTEFTKQLPGAEQITAQCHNCGNWAARVITRWPWFTVCWVPVLPLATHKYTEVACPICNFMQDLKNRPDVQQQIGQGQPMVPPGGGPPGGGQQPGRGQSGPSGGPGGGGVRYK